MEVAMPHSHVETEKGLVETIIGSPTTVQTFFEWFQFLSTKFLTICGLTNIGDQDLAYNRNLGNQRCPVELR